MKKLQVEKTSSRGIVIAPVYLYQEADLTPDEKKIEESQIEAEKARFQDAKEKVTGELKMLSKENEIFAAHLEIAEDFTLTEGVNGKIDSCMNAEMAGNPKAVPLLLDMGLDEFSVSASNIDYVRKMVLEY